uniref:Uncharacterized protein n=1 Tax=Romanomermis culicivorax TaxID=13658 RepID=A0A915INS2_ROMCU
MISIIDRNNNSASPTLLIIVAVSSVFLAVISTFLCCGGRKKTTAADKEAQEVQPEGEQMTFKPVVLVRLVATHLITCVMQKVLTATAYDA